LYNGLSSYQVGVKYYLRAPLKTHIIYWRNLQNVV
jgi:hypothetical protein